MSTRNPKPTLYQLIADTIRARITSGQYKPGEKIPTIRQFSTELGYNKVTVHRAFERLKLEGLIENKVGSGSFIRFPEKIHSSYGRFDFRTDYLHESFFPYRQAQAILNGLFDVEKAHALSPTPAQGDPELLRVLSRFYHLPEGQMLMISGAQQGLDLVSKVFGARISESILFEDPTYPGAISLFRARHFVPLESDGPDLDKLDKKLSDRIRLFYTMPAVHNPTGISYSIQKKEAVAQRAREHSFFIIEDAYLGELKDDAPRFVDLCSERTIFIKSLAQTTLAGIRLGFMVVPGELFQKFVFTKYSSDITSFGLLQKFLREFIQSGGYAAHMEMVRRKVEKRRRRLLALTNSYSFLSTNRTQSGYSLWLQALKAPRRMSANWSRGDEFSFSPEFKTYFKLAFMGLDDAAFEQGLEYLKSVLEQW